MSENIYEDVDDTGWDVEPGDEIEPVIQAIGALLKFWREKAGLSVAEFAVRMKFGEDMIRKMENGRRIPRPEFLEKADRELRAEGCLRHFMETVRKARYPKTQGGLREKEGRAVEFLLYSSHNIHGLLQTPEYARAVFDMRHPPLSGEVLERALDERLARKSVFQKDPTPTFSFIQEQVTLERPFGGKEVLRRQLEHILDIAQLKNVTFQIMPTEREEHAGTQGRIHVLKFVDGSAVGRSDGAYNGRPVSNPRDVMILEGRYGMIRSQALSPRESRTHVEQLLGRL
ncbi:transcriptional regulator [Streptomyces sp. V2]|uniref:Helix-turn-helix domain-containing protein n=1 Tax=Streptomyces niveiscabiei TaxID=164115 RepID=A0ABW9HIA6_9ACTN|nr:helix-turn-helix transcriptional regulator [Streptomyces sp. V2]PWG09217.1 transcriptional regulator [Streptomyces sp. V2]